MRHTTYVNSCAWFFFFSSRRRHTRSLCDWSSDVCSSDLSKGFRPGGVNRTAQPGVPPYAADFLKNYEIGWKTQLFDHHLRRSEERRVGKECRSRRARQL